MMVIMMMVIKRMIVIFRTWLSSSSPTCSLSPRGKVRSASSSSTTVREIWSRWCYSGFQADEDDVLWHQRYIMIIFKVSELESSEGVPGLGGGDQAGFALWLTLLQVSFWFFHCFIIFAPWQAFFSLSYILCMVIMLCWWIKWTIASNSTIKVKVKMTLQVKIQFQLITNISYS